ncbi:MAG: MFS transporter, partial [Solirubrobacteraceae bacterium]
CWAATTGWVVGVSGSAFVLLLPACGGTHPSYFPAIFAPFALLGAGAGMAFLPLMTLAMANVPPSDAGLASGIVNASLQVSAAIGIAALATIAADHTKRLAALGQPHADALTAGFHLAWEIGAGSVAVGALVALLTLRPPRELRSEAGATEPSPEDLTVAADVV